MTRFALSALLALGLGVSAMAEEAAKVERLTADKWCATHDLPKDKCAVCDKKLIPKLKKEKDWCAECGVAESTCLTCHPKEGKAVRDALRPAAATPAAPAAPAK